MEIESIFLLANQNFAKIDRWNMKAVYFNQYKSLNIVLLVLSHLPGTHFTFSKSITQHFYILMIIPFYLTPIIILYCC